MLIDEIDKADIEFPNDLLRELDRMEFYVYETQRTIKARHRPLVVITSNNEKELPDAFLRRCFFHYIRFPDRETMTRIVDVHFPGLKKALLTEALEVFFDLREVPGLKKKPSTSELLDWLKLLLAEDIPPEALRSSDKKVLIPPLHGALLKNEQDVHLFERVAFMARPGGRLGPWPFAEPVNARGRARHRLEPRSASGARPRSRARRRSRLPRPTARCGVYGDDDPGARGVRAYVDTALDDARRRASLPFVVDRQRERQGRRHARAT